MKNKSLPYWIIIVMLTLALAYTWRIGHEQKQSVQQATEQASTTKQTIKQASPKNLFKNAVVDIYAGIQEQNFVTFAKNTIEKRCPFDKPDAVTYQGCLSDWSESLRSKASPAQLTQMDAYCETFVKKYTEEGSIDSAELYSKCTIYKITSP